MNEEMYYKDEEGEEFSGKDTVRLIIWMQEKGFTSDQILDAVIYIMGDQDTDRDVRRMQLLGKQVTRLIDWTSKNVFPKDIRLEFIQCVLVGDNKAFQKYEQKL